MKSLLLGIAALVLIAFAGFFYRNVMERPPGPMGCTLEAKLCPDGTAVGRTGPSCQFAECAPPNVSLPEAGISFVLPEGFARAESMDSASVATYENLTATSTMRIDIRRYSIHASSTALQTIQATALGGASGEPVPSTAYTSTVIGTHRFTVVAIGRFEGVVDTAYYLVRGSDVIRFDAIDTGVTNWTDQRLNVDALPAAKALRMLLSTLQLGAPPTN